MQGLDPYAYMQQVSLRLHELGRRADIEPVLDELGYLFELIPPELWLFDSSDSRPLALLASATVQTPGPLP
jgi:hypothetical protein